MDYVKFINFCKLRAFLVRRFCNVPLTSVSIEQTIDPCSYCVFPLGNCTFYQIFHAVTTYSAINKEKKRKDFLFYCGLKMCARCW